MSDSRWHRLNEVFQRALDAAPEARDAVVRELCRGDAALADEVARLLAAHERSDRFMEQTAIASARLWLDAPDGPPVGQRVAAYRLVRELGRGGMGAVYLAERADGQYEQRVALKLIKRGMDTEQVLARFRAERQILASLDHANIARLLDGGTTDDGLPFFAMEYVEGVPIDEYADVHAASIEERLQLFLQVCSAVSYAHQHLVVHRDIKPLNILVTAEGAPKLLDFGIAKVLQAGADEETSTVTGMRLLTPEYASPEQVEGRHATTVSDVYALGVVLYELLTGRSPYRLRSRTPLDIVEAVRTTDPERPSVVVTARDGAEVPRRRNARGDWVAVTRSGSTDRLRRRLRGDLDTILLTALRKEPARRYPSVDQFAEDIRRHLAGLPVRARPDTFRYRTGKFARRNRVPVAAAALVLLALLGGITATAWQARQARAAQARAERRFNDVRKLANAVLFDYHDAIRELRGSMAVRERLVRDALGYLDGLAQEAHGDAALQRELAGAYRRVGDVQGGDPGSSLGDAPGAIASYRKAAAILEELLRADSTAAAPRRDLAQVSLALGRLVWESGDLPQGLAHAQRARALLAPLVVASPADTDLRIRLSAAYDLLGTISIDEGQYARAQEFHRADLDQLERAPPAEQQRPEVRRAISVAYGHLADAQVELGDLRGALESHRRSLAIRTALATEFPDNANYEYLVGSARYYMATVLGRMNRWAEALDLFNVNLRHEATAFGHLRVGEALAALDRHEEATMHLRRALELQRRDLLPDSTNLYNRLAVAEGEARLCKSVAALHRPDGAAVCASAAAIIRATPVEPTNAFPRAHFGGLWPEIGAAYEALAAAGGTVARSEARAAAADAYRQAVEIWADLTARGLVAPADTARLRQAKAAVARLEGIK